MADKQAPIGICDLCGEEIPAARHYTTKGKPRLYCSRDCRNTANSRAGAGIRSRKMKKRIQRGDWENPHLANPPSPEEQARRARLGRKREVEEGTWRNPALSPEARRKLSRPRKHGDRPVLHSALEKLKQGASVDDLTEEEQEAHRAYRRRLYATNREQRRAWYRRWYRKRQATMTPAEREEQRARWRRANRKRAERLRRSEEE